MSHVLIAWEFGANYGHVARQLPIAQALRGAGHEVMFAVRDTRVAAQVLAPRVYPFAQAPTLDAPVRLRHPPATYAELLLAEGYGDHESLQGRVRAWLTLFDLWKPGVVVVDHAPTALLAARAASIPAVSVGHGFEIPPDVTPLPTIRTWEAIDPKRIERSESIALESVNSVLEQTTGARRLTRLSELFTWSHQILATFRELDQFQQRTGGAYAGPLFGDISSDEEAKTSEANSTDRRPSVFAYLHNGVPGLRTMLRVLAELEIPSACVIPQLRSDLCHRFSTGTLTVSPRHRSLRPTLMGSELVVCPGGIGVVAQALLAGAPMLLLPGTVEQFLLSQRVQAIGAGLCVRTNRRQSVLREHVGQVLHNPEFRAAAKGFAKRYRWFQPAQVVENVIEQVTQVIRAGNS